MAVYKIYEGNLEKLEKKLKTIENKCKKFGASFEYKRLDKFIEEVEIVEGENIEVEFVNVEVSGNYKLSDWTVVAAIDIENDIKVYRSIYSCAQVPERFLDDSDMTCEHCYSNRNRKHLFILHNDKTDEWKQVGSTCVKDFTGVDAEHLAQFMSYYRELEEADVPRYGISYTPVFSTKEVVAAAKIAVDKFGYQNAYSEFPTKERVSACFKKYVKEASENTKIMEYAESAIEYVLSSDENSDYFYKLRMLLKSEYIQEKMFGLAVSVIPTYQRALDMKEREAKRLASLTSKYVGEIKERITVEIATASYICSGEGMFGYWYLYKFIDKEGNVFTWFSSSVIDIDTTIESIVGTVKEHSEYRGEKQTVLTRVRVNYKEDDFINVEESGFDSEILKLLYMEE